MATTGPAGTQAWDAPDRYIVDDECGGSALLWFRSPAAIGVFSTHQGWRDYDTGAAIAVAPEHARDALSAMVDVPLFQPPCIGVSAVCWEDGGTFGGSEAWHHLYVHGGYLVDEESLDDEVWMREAPHVYGLDQDLLAAVARIAPRRIDSRPLPLTRQELDLIVPAGAPWRDDALDRLLNGGAFVVAD